MDLHIPHTHAYKNMQHTKVQALHHVLETHVSVALELDWVGPDGIVHSPGPARWHVHVHSPNIHVVITLLELVGLLPKSRVPFGWLLQATAKWIWHHPGMSWSHCSE